MEGSPSWLGQMDYAWFLQVRLRPSPVWRGGRARCRGAEEVELCGMVTIAGSRATPPTTGAPRTRLRCTRCLAGSPLLDEPVERSSPVRWTAVNACPTPRHLPHPACFYTFTHAARCVNTYRPALHSGATHFCLDTATLPTDLTCFFLPRPSRRGRRGERRRRHCWADTRAAFGAHAAILHLASKARRTGGAGLLPLNAWTLPCMDIHYV